MDSNRVGIFLTLSSLETHRDHGASAAKENDDDKLDTVSRI
jgi:hypothetical protein